MQKSAKDRLFYGVVFFVFITISFVFFRQNGTDNYKGSLVVEQNQEINMSSYESELLEMLKNYNFIDLKCDTGVWPTVKCDFEIKSDLVEASIEVNKNLDDKVNAIKFPESFDRSLIYNESLSCFDLNNQSIYQNPDGKYYGVIKANCILNTKRIEDVLN